MKPKLLVVLGPTASGKSALASELAVRFQGELISADSRQVYKGLDIGTAKGKPFEGVKLHLIDLVNPDEPFTLRDYQDRAYEAISEVVGKGKLPILVGGTALYIDALVDNWDIPEVGPNIEIRKILEDKFAKEGLQALVKELRELDPETAKLIDVSNPRRVIRALEVAKTTGESFIVQRKKGEAQFDVLKIGLTISREALTARLQARTKAMIARGLVEETRSLIEKYPAAIPLVSGIGYREVLEHLAGKISIGKAEALIVQRSLQYAKRQMTWWKRDQQIQWIENPKDAQGLVENWLKEH